MAEAPKEATKKAASGATLSNAATGNYTAENITWLEGLEAVRHRPGMYIGDVNRTGLFVLCREVLDNSTDEAMGGYANEVTVRLLADNVVSISDNGRGIPVETHSKTGRSALELVMTELHAGGKFDQGNYKVAAGLHGVGVSVVNALSEWVEVEVKRYGKLHKQRYEKGFPMGDVEVIGTAEGTGTTVTYKADASIFTTDQLDLELVTKRLRELSYLVPTAQFTLENHRVEPMTVELYQNKGGLAAFCEHLNKNKTPSHRHPIHFLRSTDKMEVEVALQYNEGYHDTIVCFANTIHNVHGGLHESGFKTGLTRAIKTYAKNKKLLKPNDPDIQGEDVREGLAAVISVKVPEAMFDSQAKVRLTGPPFIDGEVNSAVGQGIAEFLDENPNTAARIVQKCVTAAQAREAARKAADLVKRKNALESDSLPGKLADCSEKDPRECEIYLVEGDSAGGCFSGDTKVALADGRDLSFAELVAEQEAGKEHFCYTIRRDGQIGLERALHARVTKRDAQVVRVTLDSGEEIVCTPDHRFMLREGDYKEAAQLSQGDSLMPLYRKLSDKTQPNITIEGYEMAWDPRSACWLFTHLLADWHNRWQGVYQEDDGDHCHHVDFNKRNNNPTNIMRLPAREHLELHRQHATRTLHRPDVIEKCRAIRQSEKFRAKMSERMKEAPTREVLSAQATAQWQSDDYKDFMAARWREFYEGNAEYRQQNAETLDAAQREYWADDQHRQAQAERVRTYFENNPQARQAHSDAAQKQWQNEDLKEWRRAKTREQWTPEFRASRRAALDVTYYRKTMAALKNFVGADGSVDVDAYQARRRATKDKSLLRFDKFCQRYFENNEAAVREAIAHHNHRVVRVEKLTERVDVYDLEVPGTHNFALASGVFVHNSAKQGRDRRFQAILPLRGKIINVEKNRLDKILGNEEIRAMITAFGTGIAERSDYDDVAAQIEEMEQGHLDLQSEDDDDAPPVNGANGAPSKRNMRGGKVNAAFDLTRLRYHRIIIMCDADVDGSHIRTLLLTFFFRYMRPLVESGHIYIAKPPLYSIRKGKQIHYAYTDRERDQILKQSRGDVGRFKGLGEMNPEELWSTTMEPEKRVLIQVTVEDAADADQIFSILMGDAVEPRKEFIEKNAKLIDAVADLDI